MRRLSGPEWWRSTATSRLDAKMTVSRGDGPLTAVKIDQWGEKKKKNQKCLVCPVFRLLHTIRTCEHLLALTGLVSHLLWLRQRPNKVPEKHFESHHLTASASRELGGCKAIPPAFQCWAYPKAVTFEGRFMLFCYIVMEFFQRNKLHISAALTLGR